MITTKFKEVQVPFREINDTRVFMVQTPADYRGSMTLLKQNNLVALTPHNALVTIDRNPELKELLKGAWFYVEGQGTGMSGHYTFNKRGDLLQGIGDMEKTVFVANGRHQLSLGVLRDIEAYFADKRFVLTADYLPEEAAPAVVGISIGHAYAQDIITPSLSASAAKTARRN